MDWLLLLRVAGITVWGGFMIGSTQLNETANHSLQHWVMGGIGVALTFLIARWHYERLLSYFWLIYSITNLSLVAVWLVGIAAKGAQRRITIARFN